MEKHHGNVLQIDAVVHLVSMTQQPVNDLCVYVLSVCADIKYETWVGINLSVRVRFPVTKQL